MRAKRGDLMKTPAEVAKALEVSAATVRRLRAKAGLSPRKRGQGYTEEDCAQLCAQLRYHPRAHTRGQLRASERVSSAAQDEVSYLKDRMERLESRLEALEALLTNALAVPWSVRTAGVSDSPASVPAFPSPSKPSTHTGGRKLRLPSKTAGH